MAVRRMKVWVNIAASNNAWSGGVTKEHLATIARQAPAVRVYDLSDETAIGVTTAYEIRAEGAELWALLELERKPGGDGSWHAESVIMARELGGEVELGAVALTTLRRGLIQEQLAERYPGRVGKL